MFEFVTTRLLQGILSGIGLATLFYFYPIMKHILNDKYRRKFQIAEFGKELFSIVKSSLPNSEIIFFALSSINFKSSSLKLTTSLMINFALL